MTDYQNSATLSNLQAAFARESMARNKYTYYAAIARKEGHKEIAETFEKFSENEREHARIWAGELHLAGGTDGNLRAALEAELVETEELYPAFADTAQAEGFEAAAHLFRKVAEIESRHAIRFRELLDKLEGRTTSSKKPMPELGKRFLLCRFCGALEVAEHGGTCPVCKNPDAF